MSDELARSDAVADWRHQRILALAQEEHAAIMGAAFPPSSVLRSHSLPISLTHEVSLTIQIPDADLPRCAYASDTGSGGLIVFAHALRPADMPGLLRQLADQIEAQHG